MSSIIFVTGSLRRDSYNTKLAKVASGLVPPGVDTELASLEGVPPYDADGDGEAAPDAVRQLRAAIAAADGVFWTVPEYNYGLAGLVKNAIDWISRPVLPQNCVVGKPMNAAVATTSATNGVRALVDLKRYWNQLGGISVPTPDCVVNLAPQRITEIDGSPHLADELVPLVRLAVECLCRVIDSGVSTALVENWRAYVRAVAS